MKRYCKNCIFYIEYNPSFAGMREGEDGRGICGATLHTYTDEIGNEKFKTYGEYESCEKCGTTITDNRSVRFQKCRDKNKGFKCNEFKPKWYLIPFYFKPKAYFKIPEVLRKEKIK